MITLNSAVVVEGKYDKITLENIIDATIVTTDGFGIYKNKEKREFIKRLAKEKGIIIITDSDFAGLQIRSLLKNICGEENIINVYIPQIKGKEKRKTKTSSAGFLGVEGMDEKTVLEALKRSGVSAKSGAKTRKITKLDMYLCGLSGKDGSAKERNLFCEFVSLPKNMSSSAFLDAVNALYTYGEFLKEVELWRQDADKK